MFELSDYLIGIYKVNDCTDTVCIRNDPPEIELQEEHEKDNSTEKDSIGDNQTLTENANILQNIQVAETPS